MFHIYNAIFVLTPVMYITLFVVIYVVIGNTNFNRSNKI